MPELKLEENQSLVLSFTYTWTRRAKRFTCHSVAHRYTPALWDVLHRSDNSPFSSRRMRSLKIQSIGEQTNSTAVIKSHGYYSSFSCSSSLAGQFIFAVHWISCLPSHSHLAWGEDPGRTQQQMHVLIPPESHQTSKKQALLRHPSNEVLSRALTKQLHMVPNGDCISGYSLEKLQTPD